MALVRRKIPHPEDQGRPLEVFRSWKAACDHLRDHLLTAPECLAWALVCPEYGAILDPGDADARYRYHDQACATEGASAQELYDAYCRAIHNNTTDAARLRWVRSADGVTVALGTDGVLVMIVGREVRTAFLPGQGSAQATRESSAKLKRGGLPRDRGMRSGRPERGSERESHRDRVAREEREARWTRLEKLYYRVFRPAVQFIQKTHRGACDTNGQVVRSDYALVKSMLPPQSRLTLADWQILRRVRGQET